MSGAAIALMILSMIAIWGGLIASSIFLRRGDVPVWPEGAPED